MCKSFFIVGLQLVGSQTFFRQGILCKQCMYLEVGEKHKIYNQQNSKLV
jgi:hypothetical protein